MPGGPLAGVPGRFWVAIAALAAWLLVAWHLADGGGLTSLFPAMGKTLPATPTAALLAGGGRGAAHRPAGRQTALAAEPTHPFAASAASPLSRGTPSPGAGALGLLGLGLGLLGAAAGVRRLPPLRAKKEDYDNAQAWQYFLGNYQRPGKPKWMGGKQWAGYLPQKPDKIPPIYRSPNQDYDPPPRMPQWIDPDDTRTQEQRVLDKWNGSKWAEIFATHGVALDAIMTATRYAAPGRIQPKDVLRLAQGLPARKYPPGYPVRTKPPRFTPAETLVWSEAIKKGVVELPRGRLVVRSRPPASQMGSLFRNYCDAQVRPHVVVHLGPLNPYGDTVEVDASPLRMSAPCHYEAFFRICDSIAQTFDCVRVRQSEEPPNLKALLSDTEALEQLSIERLPSLAVQYSCRKRSVACRLARQVALFWNGQLARGNLIGFKYDIPPEPEIVMDPLFRSR
eukprot:EG_transcript_11063